MPRFIVGPQHLVGPENVSPRLRTTHPLLVLTCVPRGKWNFVSGDEHAFDIGFCFQGVSIREDQVAGFPLSIDPI